MHTLPVAPEAHEPNRQTTFLLKIGLMVIAYACFLALILDLHDPMYHSQITLHLLALVGCLAGLVGLHIVPRLTLPRFIRHFKTA
jgi:hypothetical protein